MLVQDRLDHHFGVFSAQAFCLGNVGHQVGFGHRLHAVTVVLTTTSCSVCC